MVRDNPLDRERDDPLDRERTIARAIVTGVLSRLPQPQFNRIGD